MEAICINNKGVSRSFNTLSVGNSFNSDKFGKMYLFNRLSSEATLTFMEICDVDISDVHLGFEVNCICETAHNLTVNIRDYNNDRGITEDCVIILPLDVTLFLGLDIGYDTIGVVITYKEE